LKLAYNDGFVKGLPLELRENRITKGKFKRIKEKFNEGIHDFYDHPISKIIMWIAAAIGIIMVVIFLI